MKHIRSVLTLPIWLLLAAIPLLAGCAGRSSLPQLETGEIAQKSAEAMSAIKSLHFTIDLTGALTYIDATKILALKHAEGDLAAPDRVRATIRTRTFGSTTEIEVVGIGTTQWARNPLSGRWESLPPEYGTFDIGALFNAEYGLPGLLRQGTFTREADESIDGRAHYVLATRTDGQTLAPMTSGMITRGNVDVKLWIGGETLRLSQIVLTEIDTDAEEPTRWTITLTGFDEPVEIAPPVQ